MASGGERRNAKRRVDRRRELPAYQQKFSKTGLPAYCVGARTAKVGFDWAESRDVLKKVDEELTELREAIDAEEQDHIDEELGDLLFTLANLARKLNLDPESSLRSANQKFKRRFQLLEENLSKQGRSLREATSEELEQEWRAVKLTPRR